MNLPHLARALLMACTVLCSVAPQAGGQQTVTLTLAIEAGVGSITSDAAGISCARPSASDLAATTCTFGVDPSAVITLTAVPGSGYRLAPWSTSTGCLQEPECRVEMGGMDRAARVGFPPARAGTVKILTNGPGLVTVNPPGVRISRLSLRYETASTCDTPYWSLFGWCEFGYIPGTDVTLSPTPYSAPTMGGAIPSFVRWSRVECLDSVDCRLTVGDQSEEEVVASFNPARLGVDIRGGQGSVTSNPPGIDCPSTACSLELPLFTPVTLTAHSSEAVKWLGCDLLDGPICETIVASNPTGIIAGFGDVLLEGIARISVRFRVVRGGSGHGEVSGGQIQCGSQCAADYLFGDRARLVADAAPGSEFAEWQGACGRSPVCVVPVGPVDSVRAVFHKAGDGGSSSGGGGGVGGNRGGTSGKKTPRLSVRAIRAIAFGRGKRRVIVVRVVINRSARAVLRLARGRRVVARRAYRLRRGVNRVRLRVPRRLRAGRARLTLRVTGGGRTRTVVRFVRLRRSA